MSYDGDDYEGRPRRVANTPELRTRKPTGQVAFPLVLVEGEEKAGKTYASLALSASPRVGRTFAFDLGEGTVDEYASLGRYEVVEHNGTFTDLLGQMRAAMAIESDPAKPNVIVLDSGTFLWDLLKRWTDQRARNSRKGRQALQNDPDAEIDPTMNLWNDAKDRWRLVMDGLMTWPGIAVVIARGREVAKVEGGQPVAGQTVWSVEAEKTLTFDATAWVRMKRSPRRATLVGVRSLFVDVPSQGLDLPLENTLDHLVFEVLGAGGQFGPRQVTLPQLGIKSAEAKARLIAALLAAHPTLSDQEVKDEGRRRWEEAFPGSPTEVTEADLRRLLASVAGPPPSGGQEVTPGATETAAPEPEAQTTEEDPVKAQGESWADFVARIEAITEKRDMVAHLQEANLPTSGSLRVMKDRLLKAYRPFFEEGQETAPEKPLAVEEVAEALGAEEVIPKGWKKESCVCGEPVISETGNYSATVRHLDQALDAQHQPDAQF